ncbi:MAG: hypothetical protein Sv326_1314 (plasmid) [Candidatus Fermentimicrarchaeum limneticum]|uniref:Uncharacterized protein n=1 Tax=Fermentimicrarchaeum limneticum TaxID=2795018 RepID=A0A7D5XKS2_FERL1|nr:MAG: hypothetical protein Sv326_1314 [Candidatus Fermentimicrarchaeum limneticum]
MGIKWGKPKAVGEETGKRALLEYNFKEYMQRQGVDPAYFDPHEVDETLTYHENWEHLKGTYGIQKDVAYEQERAYRAQTEAATKEAQKGLSIFGVVTDTSQIGGGSIKKNAGAVGSSKQGILPQKEQRQERGGLWGRMSGFTSRVVSGGGGFLSKVSVRGGGMIVSELGHLKHPRKPDVARFIPRPIRVGREDVSRSIIGIPAGHSGLRPVQASFRSPTSIFGDGKKKMRLF